MAPEDDKRVGRIERDVDKLRDATVLLVDLNAKQAMVLEKLANLAESDKDHEARLRVLEKSNPSLVETRSWLIAIVASILTLGAGYALTKVKEPMASQAPAAYEQAPRRPIPEGKK